MHIQVWYAWVTSLSIPNTGTKAYTGKQSKLTTYHMLEWYILVFWDWRIQITIIPLSVRGAEQNIAVINKHFKKTSSISVKMEQENNHIR